MLAMIAQSDERPVDEPRPKYRWRLAAKPDPALDQLFSDQPRAFRSALAAIGIDSPAAAGSFLARDPGNDDPFRLAGVRESVDRIRTAIEAGERIAIYGDYDADGVTASALLADCLESMGADLLCHIPHRERDGYGLNRAAMSALASSGASLLITVDCGIRAAEEIAAARAEGMAVIVTDHHALPEALPDAYAIINPHRKDCAYGDTSLSGVGLAFKLAQALLRDSVGTPSAPAAAERALLDLVAIGTVADVVPLLGENRSLVYRGLEVLSERKRPGLAALLGVMRAEDGDLSAADIGYGIGPRINAAGRMADARLALDLLRSRDADEAHRLAGELESLNSARREVTHGLLDAALQRVADSGEHGFFLLDSSEEVPLGVAGLVAARLADRLYRPVAVLRVEGEVARGSARSIPEFNLIEALDRVPDLLLRHGGHARAAGFTVERAKIPALRDALSAMAAESLSGRDLRPELHIVAEIDPASIGRELHDTLALLEPFGEGNRQPVLLWRDAAIGHARSVGRDGDHLKLVIEGGPGTGSIDAIAFGRGVDLDRLGPTVDLVFTLEVNRWRGRSNLQLRVEDLASPGQARLEPSA